MFVSCYVYGMDESVPTGKVAKSVLCASEGSILETGHLHCAAPTDESPRPGVFVTSVLCMLKKRNDCIRG